MNFFIHILFLFIFVHTNIVENYALEINLEKSHSIYMDKSITVHFNLTNLDSTEKTVIVDLSILNKDLITFKNDESKLQLNISVEENEANETFILKGKFIGRTKLSISVNNKETKVDLVVIREPQVIDHIFSGSVAILVALIYVNFGCALNWSALKPMLSRPIGPIIGFIGQFVIMPVLSFLVGLLIFPSQPDLRLGMLFTGVSPAGGASNVWTVVLDGNLDLSVTMSTISTIAAFGMMPLWLFTVGPHIFNQAKIGVPYEHVFSIAAALIIPLFVGWLIKRYLPRLATLLVRILKGFSALLILFIVIFATVTNLYLFRLTTWKICVAGLLLPWCGYLFGAALAAILRQPARDIMAIAIETGVQNTGIAIFLLRFSLPQPEADLTTIIPVAVAVMTPIPLTILYLSRKFICKPKKQEKIENSEVSEQ